MIFRKHRQARERAEQAAREADAARKRLEETRAGVVRPLHRYKEQNRFAAMIRASLIEGRDR